MINTSRHSSQKPEVQAIAEEQPASSQPVATAPAPFARQTLTADMLTTRSPEMNDWAREQFNNFLSAGQFVPFGTEQPTVVFPGFDGGAEWGGSAIDPGRGIIYINSNDIAWTGALVASPDGMGFAEALYQAQCAVCHGIDKQGSPPEFPALTNASETVSPDEMRNIIRYGIGRMPGFPALTSRAVRRLTDLLLNLESASSSDDEEEAVPSDQSFHEKVRQGFLALAQQAPDKWLVVDAGLPRREVSRLIRARVSDLLKPR